MNNLIQYRNKGRDYVISTFYLYRRYSSIAPSCFKRAILRSTPPAYPHNCPEVPTTRWQGIMTDMGLRPTAEATERVNRGDISVFTNGAH